MPVFVFGSPKLTPRCPASRYGQGAAPCLRFFPARLLHDLAAHSQGPPGEVDVIPAQAQRLTAPQPRVRDHLEQAAEPVPADRVEEEARFLTGPRLNLGVGGLRERRLPGDVERDQVHVTGPVGHGR
ncbi:hypothetical protein [Streptomyces sp. JHA26]|uniref:hypothetical protein n=1 Tax=Streptomyces sp. JHA26 TaxID=1917143 RepID=UPI00209AFA72|nr:hypothetical protein [Streptomyces sp. JHA26]